MDIVFIRKESDGTTHTFEVNDLDDKEFNAFAVIVDYTEGLLSDDDILEHVAELPPRYSSSSQRARQRRQQVRRLLQHRPMT